MALGHNSTGPSIDRHSQSYFAMSADPLVLPTGQYFIRNEETFAGRNLVEDRTGHPKAVFCPADVAEAQLASGLYPMGETYSDLFTNSFSQWDLNALPNGRYKLLARGTPTGEVNKLLYAFLTDDIERGEEWIITRRISPGHAHQYT